MLLRTMTVVRSGSELALINAVRLDPAGERELRKLGAVKHVVTLGYMVRGEK